MKHFLPLKFPTPRFTFTKTSHLLKPTLHSTLSPPSLSHHHLPSTTMSSQQNHPTHTQTSQPDSPDDPTTTTSYPTPLSPPLPQISKQIELSRALAASSRSSLYVMSKDDVVFEDQWLLVVNKPSGVYCESVLASAQHFIQQSNDSAGALEVHLANRLDRDTTGVMVITKSHKVAAKLVKAFTDHKVQKSYLALCTGSAPSWDTIRLKSAHGRSKFGAWRVYAASDVGRSLPGGSVVRDMETLFQVLSVNGKIHSREISEYSKQEEKTIIVEEKSVFDANQRNDVILVRAFPKSGRTHQIRLHCQYLGMSIIGDVKYEGVSEWKGEPCDGHSLHAESLSLEHPVSGLPLLLQAPLPAWASQAMQSSIVQGEASVPAG